MSSEKLQKAPKKPFLNRFFGENSHGEHGLKVFIDTWRRGNQWKALDYIKRTLAATVMGGLIGSLGAGVLAENKDEPAVDSIDQTNMSIFSTGSSKFAAIRTETGAQVYRLSEKSARMTLIVDPKEAGEVVSGILTDLGTHESLTHLENDQGVSGGSDSGFSKHVGLKSITVPFNNGGGEVVRFIQESKVQDLYNPGSYLRDQMIFLGNVSADIESGRYQVPKVENLPLTNYAIYKRENMNPYNFLVGALALNALMYSGLAGMGGVIPIWRRTRKQLIGSDRNGPQEPKIG